MYLKKMSGRVSFYIFKNKIELYILKNWAEGRGLIIIFLKKLEL